MRGGRKEWIEAAVDHLASAVFAAAVGFAALRLTGGPLPAVIGMAVAYLVVFRFLSGVPAQRPRFTIPDLKLPAFEPAEPEELLLTEQVELLLTSADRVIPRTSPADELVLDDILAKIGPDSRVVRLFDRSAMPSPGQLNARIERHLRGEARQPVPGDASEALDEALSELRRSLRQA